jgi:membrane-bound serine protease (ClpP class)
VVDLIAADLDDLLAQIDGREIPTASGPRIVSTSDLAVREIEQTVIERFLELLADPNIAFLLLSLGGLGLIAEIWSPGLGIPGALGVGFLILAYASFGTLPFSWAGIALVALAIALIAGEMHAPGGGILGTLGVISLIVGGLFLFDSASGNGVYGPSVRVSLWVLGIVSGSAAAIVGWLVWEMRKARSEEEYVPATLHEALIGQTAVVTRALDPSGEVLVGGEHWQADVAEGLVVDSGASVVIQSVDGLRLGVEPGDEPTPGEGA